MTQNFWDIFYSRRQMKKRYLLNRSKYLVYFFNIFKNIKHWKSSLEYECTYILAMPACPQITPAPMCQRTPLVSFVCSSNFPEGNYTLDTIGISKNPPPIFRIYPLSHLQFSASALSSEFPSAKTYVNKITEVLI